ncbi:MAG: zf-HC2 domain-containing protein [Actinomycetota bacterium]
MRCEHARVLASADLDGELADDERLAMEAHLGGCVACSTWMAGARDLRRSMTLRPVDDHVDLTEAVLARANVPTVGSQGWLRVMLAYVGVALLVLNVPLLLTGDESGAAEHVGRHLGAWGVALAVGFLYVVWRPERAIGLVPLALALAVGLAVSAAIDVSNGEAGVVSEATHLLELVGLACLWAISGGHVRLGGTLRSVVASGRGLRSA